MIGFSGASRTGKTTLAKAVAEKLGFHFYETNVSGSMKALGYDMVSNMPFEKRLEAQEALLHHHLNTLNELPRPFIADRTPIDFIGYMAAEIGMHEHAELGERVRSYIERCMKAAAMTYQAIIVCTPLPNYSQEDGKPPLNLGYQDHSQLIISGALIQSDVRRKFWLMDEDFKFRLQHSCKIIGETMTLIERAREASTYH